MPTRLKRSHILVLIIFTTYSALSFSQDIYLKLEGATDKETSIVDSLSYVKNFKDISTLLLEKERFEKQLHKLGFIEIKGISSTKSNDSTYLTQYSIGKQYRFLKVYYEKKLVPDDILKAVADDFQSDYFIIPFVDIENKLNDINGELANRGTPFKTLQLKNIQVTDNNTLRADLIISKDLKRTIDKIVMNGYEKFPRSFLKRYLKIRLNEDFNLDDIKQRTEALNELPFASQIKSPEVLFTKDSTSLYMYMEKRPSNTFDGFLGFGTNETNNKIEFDGYLNLNLTNNLNYGESIKLLYKSDENEQKTFEGRLELPYIFGSPIGSELRLNIFKKDSSFTNVNQFAKLFYQINPKSKVLLGISATQSNDLLDTASTTLINDYDNTFYNLGYSYMSRQGFNSLFPINFNLDFEAGTGHRTFEGTELNQVSFIYDVFKIFNLNSKNSIYLRSTGSFLFSDNYFFNELYRFGGINSIRGFEENSLFASSYALINSEYRYQLSKSIYINSIIDAAYFENDLSNTEEKLFGFGFGFGLLTNSGLLKFNYANGKNERQNFKFSDSKIHISLTAQF